ncbi:putative multiple RNA-binding domain-containing protein [Podospora fimiseda]|uniref:Multiple RNA-binding domain-containing protein 1 n=1 Tax=Podospora fimiseda TaxID=252190 RepID=A0AAN7BY34_9PEZI|nr:putative multiple RNA-binding domain-containing protein [Podospora fimiseda]
MKSSRVFVKNLPPSISEADFRKHFSAQGRDVTDVKLIPHRRIGFVGYKSPEDAEKAVKYFNKSFIRMSKIAVDFATPIAESIPKSAAQNAPGRDAAKNTKTTTLTKPHAAEVEPSEDDANSKKRKRDRADESDPKLQEYLEAMGHVPKKAKDAHELGVLQREMAAVDAPAVMIEAGESDDEYEDIPARPSKQPAQQAVSSSTPAQVQAAAIPAPAPAIDLPVRQLPEESAPEAPQVPVDATDDDWLRSRTNRLLDLVDPDDPAFSGRPSAPVSVPVPASDPQQPSQNVVAVAGDLADKMDVDEVPAKVGGPEDAVKLIKKTSRLFLRNLSYTVTEDDVREHFSKFGTLDEVNVPLDKRGKGKGFAMIGYEQSESALAAFQTDGTIFQGRIVHILPAAAKRDNTLDEFAISKLPLKKQQLLKKKAEAASTTFSWNSLFMSQDAVNDAVAKRLGVSKHEMLDPTDASAAVKQAVAETTVIQEAKTYFATHGVNIDAFKSQERGDTSILVKNIKNATIEELRTLFEEHGQVLRVVMPPSGTIAIVQFAQPAHCKAAFARKAYSRFKESVLFLEKGPKGLFFKDNVAPPSEDRPAGVLKPSVADLLERGDEDDRPETASLFVRNLNFSTTTEGLTAAFKPLDGFASAQVKTKTDPKRPGQVLSMGFGFVAFKTKEQAQAAQQVMDGRVLDGHKLVVKTSHKGLDAAEERRREDLAKKAAAQRTKIVIKNLPFEATKKDVRTLFSTYGKLVSVRIPKKFNSGSRGFAFAEFTTAKEALNAITALKDTHLLGRRLVLDFAEAEEVDPEEQIKAMEKKVRGQVNKVAIQKLTAGRAKVNIGDGNEEDEV